MWFQEPSVAKKTPEGVEGMLGVFRLLSSKALTSSPEILLMFHAHMDKISVASAGAVGPAVNFAKIDGWRDVDFIQFNYSPQLTVPLVDFWHSIIIGC